MIFVDFCECNSVWTRRWSFLPVVKIFFSFRPAHCKRFETKDHAASANYSSDIESVRTKSMEKMNLFFFGFDRFSLIFSFFRFVFVSWRFVLREKEIFSFNETSFKLEEFRFVFVEFDAKKWNEEKIIFVKKTTIDFDHPFVSFPTLKFRHFQLETNGSRKFIEKNFSKSIYSIFQSVPHIHRVILIEQKLDRTSIDFLWLLWLMFSSISSDHFFIFRISAVSIFSNFSLLTNEQKKKRKFNKCSDDQAGNEFQWSNCLIRRSILIDQVCQQKRKKKKKFLSWIAKSSKFVFAQKTSPSSSSLFHRFCSAKVLLLCFTSQRRTPIQLDYARFLLSFFFLFLHFLCDASIFRLVLFTSDDLSNHWDEEKLIIHIDVIHTFLNFDR